MSTPANATGAPTFAKVWQQVKGNAPTFAMIWGLILITALIDLVVSVLLYFVSFTSLYSFYSLLEDNIGGWSALQIEFGDYPFITSKPQNRLKPPCHVQTSCVKMGLPKFRLMVPILLTWLLFHAAALSRSPVTVKALIDAGANFEARDANGWTPLHWAVGSQSSDVVEA